jgi:septum site-determining protein MinC
MDKKEKYPIKGFREGLLVTLGEGDWEKVLNSLFEQIDERVEFFRGGKMAIDVGERSLRAAEMGKLRDSLAEREVNLFAVLSKSTTTEAVAETLGLSTQKSALKENTRDINRVLYNGETALLIKKTLRSGASVKYAGSVIIDGDVNPGAEVKASGSIYVWGKLRGSAQAGMDGSQTAEIAAMDMQTSNIRIANIAYQESKPRLKIKKKPEKACIENDHIKIVDWDQVKRVE